MCIYIYIYHIGICVMSGNGRDLGHQCHIADTSRTLVHLNRLYIIDDKCVIHELC